MGHFISKKGTNQGYLSFFALGIIIIVKRASLLQLSLFMFFLFFVFTFFVYLNISALATLDYKTTELSQKLIPNLFIMPFSFFSVLGSAEFTGIFLLILLFLFLRTKKLVIVVFMFVFMGLVEIFGKTVINQPGPPLYFHKTSMLLGLPSSGVSADFFAYPSGHSARTAFVSGILILVIWLNSRLSREIKMILIGGVLIFDLIMFSSRVYLGEHWASDVLGGLLLGFSMALLTSFFLIKESSK